MNEADRTLAALLAKAITALCVRNTFLEKLHEGITPSSKAGDYSDVKVVTPYGEIPWRNVSLISDREMNRLMKEIVNGIYTFLCRQEDQAFADAFLVLGNKYAAGWDKPELVRDFIIEDRPSGTKPPRRKSNPR